MKLLKRQETPIAIQRENGQNQCSTGYNLSPALKDLSGILRNNLPTLYTNGRMADLFKDQQIAAFKHPRTW